MCAKNESRESAETIVPLDNWKKTQMGMAARHSSKKAVREHLWGLSDPDDTQRAAKARQEWPRSCLKCLMVREASKFRFFKVL